MMSIQRPKRTNDDPLKQPSPFSASEIVKAARASLKEPTRPVTPADAGRRLLQSDGYSSRPQTSGGQVTSREFLHGSSDVSASRAPTNCSSNPPWRISSSNSTDTASADIWRADEALSARHRNTPAYARVANSCTQDLAGQLSVQLAGQQLQLLCRPSTGSLLPAVASSSSSSSCISRRASSAQHGSPLRPSSALACAASTISNTIATDAAAAGSSRLVTPPGAVSVHTDPREPNWQQANASDTARTVGGRSNNASSSLGSVADSAECSSSQPSIRKSSSRSSISAGSSRGSSRGSTVSDDALGRAPIAQADTAVAAGAETAVWQLEAVQAVTLLNSLPVSPAAAACMTLLQACAAVQVLLDTAEDQCHLQSLLAMPVASVVCTGTTVEQAVGRDEEAGKGRLQCLQDLIVPALVRLVDCPTPDVQIKVGSMLLRVLPVQGGMMLTAAKMLYRLSKDTGNDTGFRHHGVMRPLLAVVSQLSAACTQDSAAGNVQQIAGKRKQLHGALLYCTGCLKNISADAANQKALGRLGAVAVMSQVLVEQVAAVQTAAILQQQRQQHEAAAQVCVQVTAVLRNLAVLPNHATLFVKQQQQQQCLPLQALLQLLSVFQQQDEVLLNVSRCLSKLCLQSTCREHMLQLQVQQHCAQAVLRLEQLHCSSSGSKQQGSSASAIECLVLVLLRPVSANPIQWPLVLRVAFVLGTLTTHCCEARTAVATIPGALEGLLQLALQQLHGQQQLEQQQTSSRSEATKVPVEDMLVKLLRLLGNVAIDQTAGADLACNADAVQLITGVLRRYTFDQQEELVLNAAAALTNLVFYNDEGNKFFQLDADMLLQPLLPMLTSSSEEAIIEAARAISNLARGSHAIQAALLNQPGIANNSSSAAQSVLRAHMEPARTTTHGGMFSTAAAASTSVYEELALPGINDGSAACSYSNSSRQDGTAGSVVGRYLLQALVLLLSHGSWEVIYNVAGALLNLTTSPAAFATLHKMELLQELHAVLQRLVNNYTLRGAELAQPAHQAPDAWRTAAFRLVLQCVYNLTFGLQGIAGAWPDATPAAADTRCTDLLYRLTEVLEALANAQGENEREEGASTELRALVLQRLSALLCGGQ